MAFYRQGIPAGWTWREGRPRWIPSPTLRKAGWKGRDLKDAKGVWLPKGASIDAAAQLVLAVEGWRGGQLVSPALAASAPAGAAGKDGKPVSGPLDKRSIGALLDAYQASKSWTEDLKPKTQADRKSKLSRFLDVLAGYVEKPAFDAPAAEQQRYRSKREKARAFLIDVLEPPPFESVETAEEAQGLLYDVYWKLHGQVGVHMAHGVLANVSAWLAWCTKLRAVPANWAKLVDRETPPGRIRVGTWDELAALIKAAETMGLHSIADAIVLGVDLSWSQVDRINLKWPQIDADGRVKATRQKTGRKGATPLLDALGKPRLVHIRKRQVELYGEDKPPLHVLICEDTGQPWRADWYRHRFADVRTEAAKDCPSVADLRDQDLRDTAITVSYEAGLDLPQIASRTLHSLRRITDVMDKHYGEIGQGIADRGADKLNTYLSERGITL